METDNRFPEEPIREVADEDRERYEAVKEEVDRKTDTIYVQGRLSEVQKELAYWRRNRDVILQITAELEKAESQEIGDPFFLRLGDLLTQMKGETDDVFDSETYADMARDRYKRKGIAGIKDFLQINVNLYYRHDAFRNGIDETIRRSEAEVRRITDIIENNSVEDAASELYIFGACHEIWDIKQNILKTEYGIDWKTPSETHPYIDFD